jgi:hypothetical protein
VAFGAAQATLSPVEGGLPWLPVLLAAALPGFLDFVV